MAITERERNRRRARARIRRMLSRSGLPYRSGPGDLAGLFGKAEDDPGTQGNVEERLEALEAAVLAIRQYIQTFIGDELNQD